MSSNGLRLPSLTVRQVILVTLTVALVALAFWLLFRYYQVVFILFVALVISTALKPVVDRLHQWGIPRPLGIILLYGLLLVVIAGFAWLGIPLLTEQIGRIGAALPEAYQELRSQMLSSPNFLIWRLGNELPVDLSGVGVPELPPSEGAAPETGGGEEAAAAFNQGLQWVSLVARTLFAIVAVMTLAFYWTLDSDRTKRTLLLLVPAERREYVRQFVADIEEKVGAFVIGQTVLCLLVGLMALVAYLLIGLPYALVLALVAGILEAMPIIGPGLGAIPAGLVALSVAPTKVIWVVLATVIIQQVENAVLVPRIMQRAVGVRPIVTLLAILGFGSLFGLAGALVAVPIAAIVQLFLDRFLLSPEALEQPPAASRDELSVLRYETQELVMDLRKIIRHKEQEALGDADKFEDSLEAIAADLDSILEAGNGQGEGPEGS
ncbi:MAG: AI-2E family transporter [Chloroflexi bacterium]|nr:AI-2E family transporter [Chloroflexota bacterium]MCI0576707.1 AI-2E family transporter [Chloroflexota bacterium]MCI0649424.1 AI-2E family transporter [Chloroflexota bacterium]MCI0730776.1 AI-2E family transporter [Chloroflexota bacterium]